MYEILHAVEN